MSAKISSISINSSSKSCTSSAIPVAEVVNSLNETNPIIYCILGMSKIGKMSDINKRFEHAALLLMNKIPEYDYQKGVLIEYGEYYPKMGKEELNYVQKELVIYRYGEKGGLRYYVKNYGEFTEEFGNIGYVDLKINSDHQMSFRTFIDQIAPITQEKWIKNNYSLIDLNCQNFIIDALQILKPNFSYNDILARDPNLMQPPKTKRLNFFPPNIKSEIIKYKI